MIQLDTSFLIRALVAGSPEDRLLRAWIQEEEAVGISALAWAEFVCGPVTAPVIEIAARLLGEPLPFTAAEAAVAARLFNDSGHRRGPLMDCMIAAMALHAGDTIATSNRADFTRFEKLGLAVA